MNLFRSAAVALAMTTALASLPAHAQSTTSNVSGDPLYTAEAPRGFAMMGDLLIARPLLIAATLVGTGAFIVSLPFTALGGNVGEAAEALIAEPGREAFARCLGCSSSHPGPGAR
ncbi:multidrug transporter [Stutzerimonas tarimensis]|uniref:Multidrug transporter n=1 Tax=Stutzerimonas tarimensis TaxID=1507735 RepID=A0ABV7T6N1_9GAMM